MQQLFCIEEMINFNSMGASSKGWWEMKPRKSVWFALPYAKRSMDVGIWDGEEREGKPSGSKISLRIRRDGEDGGDSAFLHPADALKLAAALQHYAFEALEADSEKRREAWRQKKDAGSVPSGAPGSGQSSADSPTVEIALPS